MEEKKEFVMYPEIGAIYTHYKGGKYEVLTLAKHSETNEDLVIYKSVGYGSIHARPLSMWFEKVKSLTSSEIEVDRFEYHSNKGIMPYPSASRFTN